MQKSRIFRCRASDGAIYTPSRLLFLLKKNSNKGVLIVLILYVAVAPSVTARVTSDNFRFKKVVICVIIKDDYKL